MHRGCSHCEEVVDLYGGDRPKYEQLVDWLGRAILYLILDMLGGGISKDQFRSTIDCYLDRVIDTEIEPLYFCEVGFEEMPYLDDLVILQIDVLEILQLNFG